MNFKLYLKKVGNKLYFKLFSRRFHKRLTYCFMSNKSETLIIVFSGFASKPVYNYVNTLRNIKADKLFILDDFGYKGSYYWFENGRDYPRTLTESLISSVMGGQKYKRIITAGSSKGGTCAIYFGLKFHANHIFAGACQYLVGNYLYQECNREKFYGMMGYESELENRKLLNEMVASIIEKERGNNDTHIHLLYSDKEHTYEDDILPLLRKLNDCNMQYDEVVCDFDDHSDVGIYFAPYLRQQIKELIGK